LAAYLPIAFIRDCLLKFLRRIYKTDDDNVVDKSSVSLDSSPTNNNSTQGTLDIEQQQLVADENCVKDMHSDQKEGNPTVSDSKHDVEMLKHQRKLSTKEIAILGLAIGPIWFLSEVRGFVFFFFFVGAGVNCISSHRPLTFVSKWSLYVMFFF
jgi:hypothetical protein